MNGENTIYIYIEIVGIDMKDIRWTRSEYVLKGLDRKVGNKRKHICIMRVEAKQNLIERAKIRCKTETRNDS